MSGSVTVHGYGKCGMSCHVAMSYITRTSQYGGDDDGSIADTTSYHQSHCAHASLYRQSYEETESTSGQVDKWQVKARAATRAQAGGNRQIQAHPIIRRRVSSRLYDQITMYAIESLCTRTCFRVASSLMDVLSVIHGFTSRTPIARRYLERGLMCLHRPSIAIFGILDGINTLSGHAGALSAARVRLH